MLLIEEPGGRLTGKVLRRHVHPFELELGLTFSSVKSGAGIIPIPLGCSPSRSCCSRWRWSSCLRCHLRLRRRGTRGTSSACGAGHARRADAAVCPPASRAEADVELEATFVVSLGVSSPHATVDRPIQVPIKSAARVAECIRICHDIRKVVIRADSPRWVDLWRAAAVFVFVFLGLCSRHDRTSP